MNVGNWINLGCIVLVVLFFLALRWADRRYAPGAAAERARRLDTDDDGMRTERSWWG